MHYVWDAGMNNVWNAGSIGCNCIQHSIQCSFFLFQQLESMKRSHTSSSGANSQSTSQTSGQSGKQSSTKSTPAQASKPATRIVIEEGSDSDPDSHTNSASSSAGPKAPTPAPAAQTSIKSKSRQKKKKQAAAKKLSNAAKDGQSEQEKAAVVPKLSSK